MAWVPAKPSQGGGLVASRTQIVCLCEGAKGKSIDEVFINKFLKTLKHKWIRPQGSNMVRIEACGSRSEVIKRMPEELRNCLNAGADTTLMVWSDCDDNCEDGDALKRDFWSKALQSGITQNDFDRIVFIFAKDRLENWIQFLNTGQTNEAEEGPKIRHDKEAAEAAKKLAEICRTQRTPENMPPSLRWSCNNWRTLVERMKAL